MNATTASLDRALKFGVIVSTLCLAWLRISPLIQFEPVSYVRPTVIDLQERTTPRDAQNTRMEIVGYFPLAPSAEWEFESDENWPEYRRTLQENLAADFTLFFTTDDRLYFRRNWPGQIEYLHIDLVSNDPRMRIRCGYLQFHDPFGD